MWRTSIIRNHLGNQTNWIYNLTYHKLGRINSDRKPPIGNQIPLPNIFDKVTKENGPGLTASLGGLKKDEKKDAKLEANETEIQ